jgi:hypothetical protein
MLFSDRVLEFSSGCFYGTIVTGAVASYGRLSGRSAVAVIPSRPGIVRSPQATALTRHRKGPTFPKAVAFGRLDESVAKRGGVLAQARSYSLEDI